VNERWLVLAGHVPPGGALGGMIRYTVEVTRSLQGRCDVTVFVHCTPAATGFFRQALDVSPDRILATARAGVIANSVHELLGLHRSGASRGFDVVFGSKHLVPLRASSARRLLVVHDMIPVDRPGDFNWAKRHLLPPAYLASIQRAELLVCDSQATRTQLARLRPEDADRASVVPLAMTPGLLTAAPRPVAGLMDRPFALVVGDLSPRKNVGFLLELWPRVVEQVPGARLAIVGPPGWGRNGRLTSLSELVATGSVVVLGHVDDSTLRWCYEHTGVALCPSRLEGFGLPALEASAFGCPLVVSEDPALWEASGGAAVRRSVDDAPGWVAAVVDQLRRSRVPVLRPAIRTWDEVTDDLVEVTRQVRPPTHHPVP
jgi:glycosyltransferase involved in cell wall biosynthesis